MKKGQVWYVEFIAAIIIVSLGVGLYIQFLQSQVSAGPSIQELHTEAVRISEQLIGTGSPSNWTEDDIRIAGLTDGNYRINYTKASTFYTTNISLQRVSLTTDKNFYISLRNTTDVISIASVQGVGQNFTGTKQASVSRFLIYNSTLVELRVEVWE